MLNNMRTATCCCCYFTIIYFSIWIADVLSKEDHLDSIARFFKSSEIVPGGFMSPFGPNEPNTREFINATFWLYSARNQDIPQLMQIRKELRLNETFFDFLQETKVIVHGATTSKDGDWILKLKNKLINFCGCNVILVDWKEGAASPFYTTIAANTNVIGNILGEFLKALLNETYADPGMFHLIGHSVGAHACGVAGMLLNGTIGRITGLDPPAHLFDNEALERRLDPSDAYFVDVVHTCATKELGVGSSLIMGHLDFFPNGGEKQPGCSEDTAKKNESKSFWNSVSATVKDGMIGIACHHGRSYKYFTETIGMSASKLLATPCDNYQSYLQGNCENCTSETENCTVFGILALKPLSSTKGPQSLYFTTKSSEPYFG